MQNIHPMFVHFPIALLSVGFFCEILYQLKSNESLKYTGWWLELFGTIAIVLTAITGFIAEDSVKHSDVAHELIETHLYLELTALAVFLIILIWRIILKSELPKPKLLKSLFLIMNGVAVVLLLTGAHFGGRLVYEQGVGVSAVKQPEHQHHSSDQEAHSDHNHEADHDHGKDHIHNH